MNPASEEATLMQALLSRMPPRGQLIVASTTTADWGNVHGAILEGRVEEFFDYSAPFPVVMFALRGTTQIEWRRAGRYSRFLLKPGDVLITPPGDANAIRSNLTYESLNCFIGSDLLMSIAEQEWQSRGSCITIVEGINKNDAELWNLGQRLAAHLLSPRDGSRLYAESLQTQIAIQLLWNYSSLPQQRDVRAESLADRRLRKVIDYIRNTLSEDISLEALARVAGLSPNYFLGAFKQATGRTPHRYVIEQRIAKACELLRDPHRSIIDVSLAVGFSSQSHLTEVFRRIMKTTPAAYRKEVLGLVPGADNSSH